MPEHAIPKTSIQKHGYLQTIKLSLDKLDDAAYFAALEREPYLKKLVKDMNYERTEK